MLDGTLLDSNPIDRKKEDYTLPTHTPHYAAPSTAMSPAGGPGKGGVSDRDAVAILVVVCGVSTLPYQIQ